MIEAQRIVAVRHTGVTHRVDKFLVLYTPP